MTSLPFPPGSSIAAYLRDSGGDEQDLSVSQQREQVTSWCAENRLFLTHVFQDIAQPGSSIVGRVGFQQMIHHFHQPDIHERGVILWKFSRFSRDIDDAQYYRADLRRRGYIIHSLNDNIPDSTDGRIYEALIDWMNNKFLEDLSTDVKRGLRHMVTQYGAMPGVPPRGFMRQQVAMGSRRDGSPHTACRWVPDSTLVPVIQQAWHMRAAGFSIRQIHEATRLFTSRNSYPTFFRNRLYLGELVYGDLTIPDYCEPLISLGEWDAVQALNRENSVENSPMRRTGTSHPRRARSSYLLSGILFCALCGAPMSGKTVTFQGKKKMTYYECTRAHRRMDCEARRVPARVIDDLVMQSLRAYVLDPENISAHDREEARASAGTVDQVAQQRQQATASLASLRRRIDNLADRIFQEEDSPRALISKLKEMETRETELSAQLLRLEAIERGENTNIRSTDEAGEFAAHVNDLLENGDVETRRFVLKALTSRITVERAGDRVRGEIIYWNPRDDDVKSKLPPEDGSLPTQRCLHRDEAPPDRHLRARPEFQRHR